jgi:glycosyltransferase involved in cell wall biosynthesis
LSPLDPRSLSRFHLSILHTESSEGWGGQEIRILTESLGMIGRGHSVKIAASPRSQIIAEARKHGVREVPFHFQEKNPLSVWKMCMLIDREGFDLINTHSSSDSWVASLAARLSRRKPHLIRTRHLSTPISRNFLSRLIYNVLPAAIMTTGEEIRQRMIHDNRFDPSRIVSIPTGIDLQRFDPDRVKPILQPGGFSIGMIGVLRSWKGHPYFLEAVPSIRQGISRSVFYIVGDGPRRQHVKEKIQALSLEGQVFMLGHREDIPEILQSLDILVHPSTGHEGVPQTILQALAMGKPVVASDVGAIREVIQDGETGFLVPPKEVQTLVDRVIALYENPRLREKMGRAGREKVLREHSLEIMLDKIENLYAALGEKIQFS